MNRKLTNSIIIFIGFILSPLTPWNDFFINLPIAYIFAFLIGLLSEKLFNPALIVCYWLINILGFLMMHYGILRLDKNVKNYTRKQFTIDILISVFITVILYILIRNGVVKFPLAYLKK